MANSGVKVIFATSYGYFTYAEAFAKANPGVLVLHQGGFEKGTFPPNFGTYLGEAYEPVSLGGMAAGAATKTNKLGFVYAFPISQTIANIDAFELGAQKLNPKAKTYLVEHLELVRPAQAEVGRAGAALAGRRRAHPAPGLPVDGDRGGQGGQRQGRRLPLRRRVARPRRLADGLGLELGAPLRDDHHRGQGRHVQGQPVQRQLRRHVRQPRQPAGAGALRDVGELGDPVEDHHGGDRAEQPGASVFTGPIYCQDGSVLVAAGKTLTYDQINTIKCLVKGVVGTLPKS